MTREAVIVSTARTPIGKAYRGAFNDTQAQALGGHAIKHAVERAGIDPSSIQDVIMGAALQQGSTGGNVARQAALRAGLPTSVSGMSMDRQCASGLMAIATAAGMLSSTILTLLLVPVFYVLFDAAIEAAKHGLRRLIGSEAPAPETSRS